MAASGKGNGFLNRENELALLEALLGRAEPALILIRAPTGFGKSSLTTRLQRARSALHRFAVVDPSLRIPEQDAQIHEGYFLQRIAETLDDAVRSGMGLGPRFRDFVAKHRWELVKNKPKKDAISELPSLSHFYKLALDYLARTLRIGPFSPESLLRSEASVAVDMCDAYVAECAKSAAFVLILREAQLLDMRSLRRLMQLHQTAAKLSLIIEYTSGDDGALKARHEKVFGQVGASHKNMAALDLAKLEHNHVELLLRNITQGRIRALSGDIYAQWQGNLRSIEELRYRVHVGRELRSTNDVAGLIVQIEHGLRDHLLSLNELEILLVCLLVAHEDPVDHARLLDWSDIILEGSSRRQFDVAIKALGNDHGFISIRGAMIGLSNENIVEALQKEEALAGRLAIAQSRIVDALWAELRAEPDRFAAIIRPLLRLSAETLDVAGIARLRKEITDSSFQLADPALFARIVADAIQDRPALYGDEAGALLEWCARLAYQASDFALAAEAVQIIDGASPMLVLMRACALQEVGRHSEAEEIAVTLAATASNKDCRDAANLISSLISACNGADEAAEAGLHLLVGQMSTSKNPLIGYAWRFFEIFVPRQEAIECLQRSVDAFAAANLDRSRAYSLAALAVHLAREGKLVDAKARIEEAAKLIPDVKASHSVILNNSAAIELLDPEPDFNLCVELLNGALRSVHEDFSETTVFVNLTFAYLGLGKLKDAAACVRRLVDLLENPDFVDKGLYHPAAYASKLVADKGQAEDQATRLRELADRVTRRDRDRHYWAWRLDNVPLEPDDNAYLQTVRFHPQYISHWIIDMDGLDALSRG